MGVPYPVEFEDPWYATFESTMGALDGHDFAGFEDRNLFVLKGGTFTWDATISTLTWTADIELNTPSTGNLQILAAGSQIIENGELWVVDATRGASDTVTLADTVGPQIDPNDATVALAIRRGDKLYFRNGRVLDDDDVEEVFEGVVSSGPSTKPLDRNDLFTGDGITAGFTLSFAQHANCIPQVFRDGVLALVSEYIQAGTLITFTVPPLVGEELDVRYWS